MAKVIGQDIPSKYYDTYHNFFSRSHGQRHQPFGSTVKKSNWDFPGYPFHPHFPSPGQLYVRAIFKSATECWHLQPETGGGEKPDLGPIPREWWENEADKNRTFGYRKFMSDTLLYKFRIGEPTWCEPYEIPATFVCYDFPDENYCERHDLTCYYLAQHRHWFSYISRPPEDIGKEFVYLYAHHIYDHGSETVHVDARMPEWFVFDPCTLTWNTRPYNILTLSRLYVLDVGWYRFYVGDATNICFRIYFDWFDVLNDEFYGGLNFASPRYHDPALRPFFSIE